MLDAVHQIQATQANDPACRWKVGKCGSCSAGQRPAELMCMTRLDELPADGPALEPMRAFPAFATWSPTSVELSGEKENQFAASARQAGWDLADGRRTSIMSRIPQIIECFPLPGCATSCAIMAHEEFIGPLLCLPPRGCTRSTGRSAFRACRLAASATATLPNVAPRSPGEHRHHRQRDHPARSSCRTIHCGFG